MPHANHSHGPHIRIFASSWEKAVEGRNVKVRLKSRTRSIWAFAATKKALDFNPRAYIPIHSHPARGAFCRTLLNVGWSRRPRAGLVTPLPGGPGQPSGPITRARPKGLDAAPAKGGGSRPDEACRKPPRPVPGSYGAGDRNRRKVERRTATRLRSGRRARRKAEAKWWRRSALHPLAQFCEGTTPRAPVVRGRKGELQAPAPKRRAETNPHVLIQSGDCRHEREGYECETTRKI